MDIEERLKKYMEDGWNIRIECKGKGRNYEMTYEGSALNVKDVRTFDQKHGTGNTIEEMLNNIFAE